MWISDASKNLKQFIQWLGFLVQIRNIMTECTHSDGMTIIINTFDIYIPTHQN